MPALTLPLTFANSFWSTDYRKGLDTLFAKLEQGAAENDEVVAFIRARAAAENETASHLLKPRPTGLSGSGFESDEGASLLMAFRGLQGESMKQGEAHQTLAKELDTAVAGPFEKWANSHRNRIAGTHNSVVEGLLRSYELAQSDVEKLKQQYLAKVRRADEAEDDVKFVANTEIDNYTSSPRLHPRDIRNPQRTASVSERIAARFKELQQKAALQSSNEKAAESETTTLFDHSSPTSQAGTDTEKPLPSVDKGKGKEVISPPVQESQSIASPPPMSPQLPEKLVRSLSPASSSPILLAGLALSPSAISDLLKRASKELNLRPVKFPIIGEYKDCFSGEELVVWLVDNVDGFGGSLDRAEDAAKDLTEREGVLRRIGEFGNAFENSDEAYYQFRPKAFNFEAESAAKHSDSIDSLASPVMGNLAPMADNFVKRSNTFVNMVQKVINQQAEPKHVRTRVEANEADKAYRVAIRKLDRQRLGLEERIEETLKLAQKWELDRLHAVKTVLSQYQTALMHLPSDLQPSLERSATLIASFQPESDLRALIERYRTGPFMPTAQVYESITHDEADAFFGIDLRKWADGGWNAVRNGEEPKERVPEVLTAMLKALSDKYPSLANDMEKRKTWIYEVPLASMHHLREALNAIPPGQPISAEMLARYDAPVLACTVKLWALELDPPLGLWEGWDDFRRIYPTVGAKSVEAANEAQHIQEVQTALLRLPKVHLLVLQTLFGHIRELIDSTKVEEGDELYITKLALSMGRTILRPKVETSMSIQDRHPTLLFHDLLKNFAEIIPPTIQRKKRESERKTPIRKRTAPVDMRVSRSRLSVAIDPQEIVDAQLAAKNPGMRIPSRGPSPAPPVPPIPAALKVDAPQTATLEVPPTSLPVPADPLPIPVPPAPAASANDDAPPMPSAFKEPPPEKDEEFTPPPMPSFVEPPPEKEDDEPPKPPRFATPPPEVDPVATEAAAPPVPAEAPSAPVVVSPPTPRNTISPTRNAARSRSPTTSSNGSGSGERTGGANLSRSGSAETTRIRGPRGARTQRPQSSSGGGMQSMTAGLRRAGSPPTPGVSTVNAAGGLARSSASANRLSYAGRSSSPVNASDYAPRGKRGKGHAGSFSRRTMASDAEDEVIGKS